LPSGANIPPLTAILLEASESYRPVVVGEMLVILMVETGLRAAEIRNLKLKDLPPYHGKREIVVEEDKGKKDRTVEISEYLQKRLCDHVHWHYRQLAKIGLCLRTIGRRPSAPKDAQ
jgi:integrase